MHTLRIVDQLIGIIFLLCYSYQFVYVVIRFIRKKKVKAVKETPHSIAVLICARNESLVIGALLDSIRNQSYDGKYVHPFVIADNCTDNTADIARQHGAVVYTRFNKTQVGKGYALQVLLRNIHRDYEEGFDAYLVLDADNILDKNYLREMNLKLCAGYDISTSYRNSKNYGSNWISAGYALYFLRESRFLNYVRDMNGTTCAVSGTGFIFSRKVADEIKDWPYHTLTEDLEFTADQILKGYRIGFAENAVLYDEQPITFPQSWRQRLRWSKGYLQVFRKHGLGLIGGIFKGSFSCFDFTMSIAPAFILTIASIIVNISLGIWGAVIGDDVRIMGEALLDLLIGGYAITFILGLITTLSEWKVIYTSTFKKILYMFTFPLFMMTYIPISAASLFSKGSWKPISHTINVKSASELAKFKA